MFMETGQMVLLRGELLPSMSTNYIGLPAIPKGLTVSVHCQQAHYVHEFVTKCEDKEDL